MIPVFFCHICGKNGTCNFAIKLSERLRKDIKGIESFIACQNERWNNASDLNTALNQCYVFIAIISGAFDQKTNCTSELSQAKKRKQSGSFPLIIPIKCACDDNLMQKLGFIIDQQNETGDKWIDFSIDGEFDAKYEEFYRRIYYWLLDNNLVANEDFHKDRKVLDVILQEQAPTSSQIKIAIDYCRKGQEYGLYFFKNLSNPIWLIHLYASGFFAFNLAPVGSDKNEGYYNIPLWSAILYLEKISEGINNKDAEIVADIIRKVSRPLPPATKQDNWRTWQSFVKIMATLPADVITLTDIDLIVDWLDSKFDTSMVVLEIGKTLLPKFLKGDEAAVKKANRVFEIILDSVKVERRHSMISYSLQENFKFNATLLGEKCGKEVIEFLQKKIEGIVTEKDDAYCYMWRPAIEDNKQNISSDEYRHILISGLRNVFLSYALSHDASSQIESYFKSDKYIIRRFSLYVLDQIFDKYKATAEKILCENSKAIFHESNYHHELYILITHHFMKISAELQNSLIDVIHQLTGDWKGGADKEKLNAMLRRRWLYAVKVSNYAISDELEARYFKGIEYKPEHPEFLSYIGPVSWGDESLFSPSELLSQGGIDNIVFFLNNYEGKNRFGETAIREAGQSLREAVKSKQEFFEENLLGFKKAKYEYWYYVVQAFEDLVQDKKLISWGKVLEFCRAVVEDTILWDGNEKESHFPLEPKKTWIPSVVAGLIKKGVQDDELILSDSDFTVMDKIIRALLEKQEATASGKDEDALTEAINTTKGHVLECFKSYVLRQYRNFEKLPDKGIKQKESLWREAKPLFNREIERIKEGNFEFSSLAGAYLPNLYYLNKDWVIANINNIFPVDERHWRCAMQGYSYVNTVYAVIYNLLKDNGHLKRALDTTFANDQTKRWIVENVAISYLRGQEAMDNQNSLFTYILGKWSQDDIEEIISLFWSHRDAELNCDQKTRILDFWRYCFNQIKGKEEENKDILSDLNLLAVFFDQLNGEQKDWLAQSVRYVEERYHSAFLLEYLDKLADVNSKGVGDVFLVMLEKTIPSYKQENIQSIVEKIYKAGFKNEIANPICDRYVRAGFEFLTEVYKRYNYQ